MLTDFVSGISNTGGEQIHGFGGGGVDGFGGGGVGHPPPDSAIRAVPHTLMSQIEIYLKYIFIAYWAHPPSHVDSVQHPDSDRHPAGSHTQTQRTHTHTL